jgi:hypothetical protein
VGDHPLPPFEGRGVPNRVLMNSTASHDVVAYTYAPTGRFERAVLVIDVRNIVTMYQFCSFVGLEQEAIGQLVGRRSPG